MNKPVFNKRLRVLQNFLKHPLLIKKKENLLYLTGRFFMSGYLLVNPSSSSLSLRAEGQPPLLKRGGVRRAPSLHKRGQGGVIFFGDGLEKPPGVKQVDRLKYIGKYLGRHHVLQLEDQFTFAESSYIKNKIKNPPHLASHSGSEDPSGSRTTGHPLPQGEGRVRVVHGKSPVDYQRMIKDEGEIRLIRKGMQIVEKVFVQVKKQLKKKSWKELELAKFIRLAGHHLGAEDVSFPPIVASGANAAIPHHQPSNKKLKAGESIIIDFGFKYKSYCSDFTRTVFLKRVSAKLEKIYNQVEKAYNESIKYFEAPSLLIPLPESPRSASLAGNPDKGRGEGVRGKRGVIKASDVYRTAAKILAEKRLEKYFIHNLGHGVGLEIHELPNLSPESKDILQEGMVFSIEPGVYMPNLGGIRIEDLVYLKKGGVEKFIHQPTLLEENIIK